MATRRAIKAVLVDLSGTLHIEDTAIPGAQEALKRLRSAPLAIRFVTNTTKENKKTLLERLRKLQFDIGEDEIFTSLTAARNLVEQKGVRPMLLVHDSALPDFTGIASDSPNAVLIGLAPEHFNYQTMNEAFRLVLNGAPIIAIHKARYYKRKDGLALGPGPFVTALEYATDTKATVVGKPEKTFFLEALRSTGCSPEEAVMIGDDSRDDIGGAQNTGMLGILVRTGVGISFSNMAVSERNEFEFIRRYELSEITNAASKRMEGKRAPAGHRRAERRYNEGKYRDGDEHKIQPEPHLTCASFPEAVDYILKDLL